MDEAGANDADMVIAVTSSDESNIVACQIAYVLFRTPTKIARVRYRGLSDYPDLFAPNNIAIDMIINPAQLVTQRLKRQIEHPGTLAVLDFMDGQVQLAALRATPPCELIGRKILELYQDSAEFHPTFVGVMRNDKFIVPDENTMIEPHDELYFCALKENLNKVTEALLKVSPRYRRIMIAGGGNIGVSLAAAGE